MGNDICPLCAGSMEVQECAPCEQCGGEASAIDRFNRNEDNFHLVKVLGGVEIILCTGCMLDFGTVDPAFLGVPPGTNYGFEHMTVVREIPGPSIRPDSFCSSCGYRSKFLHFVKQVRSHAKG